MVRSGRMMRRVRIARRGFNHIPGGVNVLYMDGHVAFQRYSPGGLNTYPAVTSLELVNPSLPQEQTARGVRTDTVHRFPWRAAGDKQVRDNYVGSELLPATQLCQ